MASGTSGSSGSSGSSGKRSPPSGRRSRRERAGRGLDEVLHYFISEEEQAEARAGRNASAPGVEPVPGAPPAAGVESAARRPWCLAVEPARPLSVELAVEIGRALAGDLSRGEIVASFPPHPLLPTSERVGWRVIVREGDEELGGAVGRALDRVPENTHSLLVLTPSDVSQLLRSAAAERIRGLVLAVDTSNRGLGQALALLRSLPRRTSSLRVGVILISSGEATAPMYTKLKGAAQRQLGMALEQLGVLEREAGDYYALLRGVPLLDAAPDARSARSLTEISARLAEPDAAVDA